MNSGLISPASLQSREVRERRKKIEERRQGVRDLMPDGRSEPAGRWASVEPGSAACANGRESSACCTRPVRRRDYYVITEGGGVKTSRQDRWEHARPWQQAAIEDAEH
ncbi:unnamed protein product [Ectocarpus sp. 12 AP-2014]